ncbi:MAG: helix-turn-helix transcriptional regulator [Clostridiales bacterium]|nr:helix-turn-helix transcriptional regulator [Clostridiales bacterium]
MGKKKSEKEITETAAFYRQVLAVNVKITRKRLKLKQDKLAEGCGISGKYIGKIEGVGASVGLDVLAALADGLGITASDLLDPEWPKAVALRFPTEDEEK